MKASQNQPSMLELCRVYKKRKELMWGSNEGSELEDSPRYTTPMPPVQKKTHQKTRPIRNANVDRANYQQCFSDGEGTKNKTRAGPSPKQLIQRETTNAQAAHLYRSACNEMGQPKRDARRMSARMDIIPEKQIDTQVCSTQQAQACRRRCSQHPAATHQGYLDPASTKDCRPHQAGTNGRDYPHWPGVTNYQQCFPENEGTENKTRAGPSPNHLIYRKTTHGQTAHFYRSACSEMGPPKRDERRMSTRMDIIPEQRRDAQSCSTQQAQACRRHCSQQPAAPHRRHQDPTSTKGCRPHRAGRNDRDYSHWQGVASPCSPQQVESNDRAYTDHQAEYRKINQSSSQTTRMYVCIQEHTQQNEMRPAPRREMEWNNPERAPAPPASLATRRIAVAAAPRQLNTTQQHQGQPLLPLRRAGWKEICDSRNECGGRRIGVCTETDTTLENRTFARVLRKRF